MINSDQVTTFPLPAIVGVKVDSALAPASSIHFVYILQSLKSGRFYVGMTDHLIKRFHQHQRGYSIATQNRGPWWMPYYEIHPDYTSANRREREIKALKSAKSIRRIIRFTLPDIELEQV